MPFPVDMEPRKFAFGEVRLCPRCGGKRTPTFEKLGYMPDPNGDRGDDKERIRCQRCNGWGFLPNKGL